MMKTFLLLLLFSFAVFAEEKPPLDLTLADGALLKGAVARSSNPHSVLLAHDEGMIRVSLSELSQATREALGVEYDPEKAQAHKKAEDDELMARQSAQARDKIRSNVLGNMVELNGKFLSKSDSGILIIQKRTLEVIHLTGRDWDPVDDEVIEAKGMEFGTFRYTTVLGAEKNVRQYICDADAIVNLLEAGQIKITPPNKADGKSNEATARWTGVPPLKAN